MLIDPANRHRIEWQEPERRLPLIMSFQQFHGLAPAQVHESRLGEIAESTYRSPDVDRARSVPIMAAD